MSGYLFSTKSGSVYTVEDTDRTNIQKLSGGQYRDNEIYKPQGLISEGQPFVAEFAPSAENRRRGIANRMLQTSPIASIHVMQSRGAAAEARFGDISGFSNQTDYEY